MKAIQLNLRVSAEEKALYEQAASEEGQTVAAWARDVMVTAAKKALGAEEEADFPDPNVPEVGPDLPSKVAGVPVEIEPKGGSSLAAAVGAPIFGRPAVWSHKTKWCPRCIRIGAPSCPACKKLEGVQID